MSHQPEHELQQAWQMRSDYVREIVRGLWMMPTEKRVEVERELGSHLEMLVAEEYWKGHSPVQSTQVALRQFGFPASVGRRIAWEWFKSDAMQTARTRLFMAVALLEIIHLNLIVFTTFRALPMASKGLFLKDSHLEFQNGIAHVVSEGHIIGLNPFYMNLAINTAYIACLIGGSVFCVCQLRRQTQPLLPVR